MPTIPYDVQCCILDYTIPPTMQRLAMTHWALYCHYKAILHTLFDVRPLLLEFFDDPDAFRYLQSRTGLLISGSTALQFLARRSFGRTDLDLYVEQHSAPVVIQWLSTHGYQLIPRMAGYRVVPHIFVGKEMRLDALYGSYDLRPNQLLFRFHGLRRRWRITIDLIVSCHSALTAIFDFHSSAVMNFIAADCAISLFPHATFTLGLSLVFRYDQNLRTAWVLEKYQYRGYTPVYDTHASPTFQPGMRWIGGWSSRPGSRSGCWIVDLPEIRMPVSEQHFWATYPHRLSRFWSSEVREGAASWRRNGWEIVAGPHDVKIEFMPLYYGQSDAYCVPTAFFRHAQRVLAGRGYVRRLDKGTRLSDLITDFMSRDVEMDVLEFPFH